MDLRPLLKQQVSFAEDDQVKTQVAAGLNTVTEVQSDSSQTILFTFYRSYSQSVVKTPEITCRRRQRQLAAFMSLQVDSL